MPVTPSHTHLIGPSLAIVRYQFSRKKLAAATEQPPAVMHCTCQSVSLAPSRNDMTVGEFIITVVSSLLAVLPTMRKRCSRRGDISQGHLMTSVLRRSMTGTEHFRRPRLTGSSGKSVCAGNDSTTRDRHCEVVCMAAKMAW